MEKEQITSKMVITIEVTIKRENLKGMEYIPGLTGAHMKETLREV